SEPVRDPNPALRARSLCPPTSPASPPRSRRRRTIEMDLLSSRLIGILLALGLSATLWVLIVNQQNPELTGEFPSALPVEVQNPPQDLLLASELPQVRLTVSAPQDQWPRLRTDNFRVWVDLRDGTRGAREYPIQARSTDPRVRIEAVTPSAVTVRLDQI